MDSTERKKLTTGRLLSLVRGSRSAQDAVAWHAENGEPSLKDVLYEMMQRRGLSPRDMIQRCGIERSYYYHILNGNKRPSRNMILRIGLCLHADLAEMERLLRLADAAKLYPRVRRDALLIFAIQQKYTMEAANELLRSEGEPPLYRNDDA